MSTIQYSDGTKIEFSGTPTQQDAENAYNQVKGIQPQQQAAKPTPTPDQTQQPQNVPGGLTGHRIPVATFDTVKSLGNALTSSEQKFGQDIAGAASAILPESWTGVAQLKQAADAHAQEMQTLTTLIKNRKAKGIDTSSLENQLKSDINNAPPQWSDLYPSLNKSALQVLGDAGGVALDTLSGGALKGVKGFALAPKLTQSAEELAKAKEAYNALSTGGKIASIAKDTAKTATAGAALGYGYDVTQKAQNNQADLTPGLGTALGVAAPVFIGGVKVSGAIAKDQAPRIINSLIKPLSKDFSYGKNPGRAVAEMGITANSLDDLAPKITDARQTVGSQIGLLTSNLEGKAKVQIGDALNPIDKAINDANKSPRTNASLIDRLKNVKEDLLGTIEIPGGVMRKNIGDTSFNGAYALKRQVGDLTKWTGNMSDDSIINGALKQVYGKIKQGMNDAATKLDPQIGKQLTNLNEKYADLTSAEIATKYRNVLNARQNLVSMPIKVGTVAGVITSIATGGVALPAVLAGVGAGLFDKALASTAVKTRVAAWLSKESPQVVAGIVQKNPGIGAVLKKAFSKEYTPVESLIQDAKNAPKQGGFISLGAANNIHPEDVNLMSKFIDSVRLKGKSVAPELTDSEHAQAEKLAQKFKISLDKSLASIANDFSNILEGKKKVVGTTVTGSIKK